jgi:hypothetical protein
MSGHYIKTSTNSAGQTTTDDWYFTPCGDGCAQVAFATASTAQAQFGQWPQWGQWAMDVTVDAVCPDNTKVPGARTAHYVWDPNSLAGTVQVTDKQAVCGDQAGTSFTNNIQLRQAP